MPDVDADRPFDPAGRPPAPAVESHPLLRRQLSRAGIDRSRPPGAEAWRRLLADVDRAYAESDQERYLLEHSQELASQEMAALYARVRADRDLLDARVRERTQALALSEARLQSLLSLSADWIWEQDASGRFIFVSEGVLAACEVTPARMLALLSDGDGHVEAHPGARAEFERCLAERRSFRDHTFGITRDDGARRWIRISGEPVHDADGTFSGFRGVGRDVTQAVLAELRLQHLARVDGLTGLPNRDVFLAELARAIPRAALRRDRGEAEPGFALCFLDLDGFKAINDGLGHAAGDELLRLTAERLLREARAGDLVARLGGDEFVVLLEPCSTEAQATARARRLLEAVAEPVTLAHRPLMLTVSVGVARHPADGPDAATLLRHADTAMYRAKQRGKNDVVLYSAELADADARLGALESALREALVRNELRLVFQPKLATADGRLAGVEALIRWQHPVRGLVPPDEFIPVAEERGLIVPIGRWVLDRACGQLRTWLDAGVAVPSVAVNVSARQFSSETLVDDIVAAMARHRIGPQQLEIELTESALMTDPDRTRAVLAQLDTMGVPIAIDDFGTGYSSLSYLKRFPAQRVKVDRSFVSGLPDDKDDAAITSAVIAMARSLGLAVVAEGVETGAQLDALRALGCDEVQGYLLGRPMPPEVLAVWLAARLDVPPG